MAKAKVRKPLETPTTPTTTPTESTKTVQQGAVRSVDPSTRTRDGVGDADSRPSGRVTRQRRSHTSHDAGARALGREGKLQPMLISIRGETEQQVIVRATSTKDGIQKFLRARGIVATDRQVVASLMTEEDADRFECDANGLVIRELGEEEYARKREEEDAVLDEADEE